MSKMSMLLKPCPYCHKNVPAGMTECPYCHRDEKGQEARFADAPSSASLDAALQHDLNQLTSDDPYARQEAAERINQRGSGVAPHLITVLNEQSRKGLPEIAKLLGRLRDRRAIGVLTQAMKIGDEDLRTAAVWALCQMHDPQVLPDLLQEAERPNPTVQGYLAHALAGYQDPRVVPALLKLSAQRPQEVVFQALWSLGEAGDAAAIPHLRRKLSRKDPLLFAAAAASLKQLGGPVRRRLPIVGYTIGVIAALLLVTMWAWHIYR
jgi:HEAT repeat protein